MIMCYAWYGIVYGVLCIVKAVFPADNTGHDTQYRMTADTSYNTGAYTDTPVTLYGVIPPRPL